MTVQRPAHSVATPTVCYCCSRSWICTLGSVAWRHTTLCVCVCVVDFRGFTENKRVGMFLIIVMAINEDVRTACWKGSGVYVCGLYLQVNQWICVLLMLYVHSAVHLWTCRLCVLCAVENVSCLCVCTQRSCRGPDVRICLLVTPTINQKALTNGPIQETEKGSNKQNQREEEMG